MSNFTKKQVVSNFTWRYIGRLGTQVVSFFVTIVLARLISPESYGSVAIVWIFTTFLQVFVDSGLGSALVQKLEADETDFSSVFYFNIVACLVLYGLLFLGAPWVARFYDNPRLSSLLRVASLSLVLTGIRSTQETYVTRNLLFRMHFIATAVASLLSAAIAVGMAYLGCEAWAIVGQQLLNTGFSTILLWYLVPWRPRLLFSSQRLKGLLSYGWKILGAHLMDTVYSEIRGLLIGKVYSAKDLAFYNQGKTFPYMLVSGVNTSLNSVLFPVMARSQENSDTVKTILRKTIRISMFAVSSILAYLICCAEAMVEVLMTAKWLPCVIYMRILCFDSLFWPLITAHYNSYKAIGRSDLFFKIVTTTKVVGGAILVIAIPFGVIWVAVSSALSMIFQTIMVAALSRKVNQYYYTEQIHDLLKAVTPAILIVACTWWVSLLSVSAIVIFVIQTLISCGIFLICVKVSKNEIFEIIGALLNRIIKRI